MENNNPGGTGKDRAVHYMLNQALKNIFNNDNAHQRQPKIKIFEGNVRTI